MRVPALVSVSCLTALLWLAAPGSALDLNEWLPGLTLSPFFSERVEYESNVFQVPNHAQGDTVFKTIPGFLADYTTGPYSLSVGYRAEILNWVSLTQQNTTHHIGVVQFQAEWPRLTLTMRDDTAQTSDPPNTELTGQIQSFTNVLAPKAEYRLSDRFSVGTNFTWTHVAFQNNQIVAEDLNRDVYSGGGSVFWKFLPKTDLSLNYNYERWIYALSPDLNATQNIVTLGLRGDLTAKLSSTFRIGFVSRTPDSSGQPGYSGLTMGGNWIYRPTDRTTISLVTDRSPQASSFNDAAFYITTTGSLSVSQQFFTKFTVTARGTLGVNNYTTKQTVNGQTNWRDDTFYGYGIALDYTIQPWITVGAEYSHLARTSNFNAFNFQDDRFTAKVTLQF